MFGIGDNQQQNNDDPAMLDNVKQLVDDPAATDDNVTTSAQNAHAEPAQGFSSSPLTVSPTQDPATEPSSEVVVADEATAEEPQTPEVPKMVIAEPEPENEAVEDKKPVVIPDETPSETTGIVNSEELASLKQEALGHLEPLVEHLGGTPEETFKTTMMMIQANDNHKLIAKALEAAKKIEDDKVRAKAMLDIINEINYFSQGLSK